MVALGWASLLSVLTCVRNEVKISQRQLVKHATR